MAPKLNALIKN